MSLLDYVWLLPLFPLFAFGIIALGGYRNHKFSQSAAILGVLLAFIFSQVIFWSSVVQKNVIAAGTVTIPWIHLGSDSLDLGTYVDATAIMMSVVIPLVCLVIFIYSIGYMHGDQSYSRFFAYVSLFAFAMLGLVICDNLLALFVFWEIMGTCSYLLIGFWLHKPSAYSAALKAFLVTKIGDIFLLIGLLILYSETGTLAYRQLFQPDVLQNLATSQFFPGMTTATLVSLFLFAGTIGKSAQFPLHVWLPDAMEGPTPASALIHAATMVSAGIYLILRMFPLIQVSQALPVIATIGTFTAVFASLIAITQNDIKRVLAYSTISQLGYMVAAVGVGAYKASLFHLLTHTFFKALLFLAAGSVIHSIDHGYHMARGHALPSEGTEFDPNNMMVMGGLLKKMPVTAIAYFIGAASLAGFPLITSGFWSKDGILTESWHLNQVVFWVLAISAGITAFYITRQICLVFLGNPRTQSSYRAEENKNIMIIPLLILAFFSLITGWIGIPEGFPLLSKLFPNLIDLIFQSPAFTSIEIPTIFSKTIASGEQFTWLPMFIGIAFPLIGFAGGWQLYGRLPLEAGDEDPLLKISQFFRLRWFYRLLQHRFYIDEFYELLFVRPVASSVDLTAIFDNKIVDWLVLTVGRLGSGFSISVQKLDDHVFDPDFSRIRKLSLANLLEWIDDYLIDEIVNIMGFLGELVARIFHQIDERLVDGFVRQVAVFMNKLGSYVRRLQNGLLSDYLWNAFLMVLLIIATITFLK